jgi:hypothetical protein
MYMCSYAHTYSILWSKPGLSWDKRHNDSGQGHKWPWGDVPMTFSPLILWIPEEEEKRKVPGSAWEDLGVKFDGEGIAA